MKLGLKLYHDDMIEEMPSVFRQTQLAQQTDLQLRQKLYKLNYDYNYVDNQIAHEEHELKAEEDVDDELAMWMTKRCLKNLRISRSHILRAANDITNELTTRGIV
jgi:hypothetical protein